MFPTVSAALRIATRTALFAGLCAVAVPAAAHEPEAPLPWSGTPAAGMGRTGRVMRVDTSGIETNPAPLSTVPLYTWNLQWEFDPRFGAHRLTLSGADAKTLSLALGTLVSYATRPESLEAPAWDERRWALGAGLALLQRKLHVGLTSEMIWWHPGGAAKQWDWTLTGGAVFMPIPVWGMQLSMRNFVPVDAAVAPRVLSAGTAFMAGPSLLIEGDIEWNLSDDERPFDVFGGAAKRLKNGIELRAGGYTQNGRDRYFGTAGFGLAAASAQLQYALGVRLGTLEATEVNDHGRVGRLTHSVSIQAGF